ncbi:hypothetical protein DPMN_045761 [Dreissena polymorpha]|uniref:DNA helicase B winged helix domain-containing protein n=1 Tax=Dreissena polymorpha TaxID=45954 RepID=A0A9D4D6X3_DREPO|nr:hypothetical protein DPMN_045761 [Dreissena polymorpha]
MVFPDGEDSEEEGDTDIQWVGYSDVKDLAGSLQLVPPCKPKRVKGEMIDLQTQNRTLVAGTFHLKDPWWQTVILRTKKNKDKSLEAKDWNALCYKLRDDPHRLAERHADMLLTKIASSYEGKHATEASWLTPLKNEFYEYLSVRGLQDQLSLDNLETHVTEFAEHLNTQGGGGGGQKGGGGGEGEPKGGNSTPQDGHQGDLFKDAILLSEEYNQISVARAFPQLMRYLPQVLPGYFLKILTVSRQHLEQLHTLIDEQPGFLAFKDLLKKHCGLLGMETSSEALTRCGLLGRVSEDVCGAVYMYEYLKRETKENGHTGVLYDRVMDTLSPTVSTLEQSLDFLNGHKITKTIVEGGHRLVYLTSLWQAENKIAKGVAKLIKNHGEQPWDLEVDLDSEGFDGIRGDPDQLQAARLISTQPVVAISGKGGCGKTYVVTKVITTAKAQREERWTQEKGDHMADWLRDKQDRRDHLESMLEQTGSEQERTQTLRQIEALDSEREPPCPDLVELLLTAPTGKAANLLGKRAGLPSYTLHQVIYSFRNNPPHQDWKHKDVNVLVVDECSLVAVSTFAFLIELLMKHAKLRRLVLLGDVRQLPSIEPGNFLLDTFSSLNRIGCSVELRTNHRAESQLIVDNATLISKKQQPSFHREKFMFRRLPEGNPTKSGDDYLSQDIIMEVQQMLSHSDLQDHSTSQFISFTRMVCEAINDVCCSKYSGHRIRDDKKKYMFQRGDKICCTKNGYVNKYEDTRQGMTSRSQDKASVDGVVPDGGVERAVRSGEGSDISLIEGSTMGTQAGSHGMQGSQGKGASKDEKIRLCNGEIFYILDEKTEVDPRGKASTYFQLSDKDKDQEFVFWADRLQLRKQCKIRHAWARTIHTFQVRYDTPGPEPYTQFR